MANTHLSRKEYNGSWNQLTLIYIEHNLNFKEPCPVIQELLTEWHMSRRPAPCRSLAFVTPLKDIKGKNSKKEYNGSWNRLTLNLH